MANNRMINKVIKNWNTKIKRQIKNVIELI